MKSTRHFPLRFPASLVLALSVGPTVQAAGWSPLGGAAPNAAGLGMAYAGSAAIADDPSTVVSNPAGMTHLEGTQFSLGGQWSQPTYEASVAGASQSNAAQPVAQPYLYVTRALSSDWSLGFGLASPYALETRYSGADAAALATGLTRIRSRDLTAAVAYRYSEQVSLGFGVNYQTLNLDWDTNTTPYQASGSGLGWQAGVLFDLAPYMRLGVNYRSAVHHDLDGELNGVSGSNATLDTPDSLTLSVWQRYSDEWEAGGEMAYVRWSSLGQMAPTQTTFNDRDSWRFAWGAAYRHNERWKSRFGIAVDRSPVTDDNRTARLPDTNAVWLTLGAQYRVTSAGTLDAGFAWRLPDKPSVAGGEYKVGGQMLSVQYRHAY